MDLSTYAESSSQNEQQLDTLLGDLEDFADEAAPQASTDDEGFQQKSELESPSAEEGMYDELFTLFGSDDPPEPVETIAKKDPPSVKNPTEPIEVDNPFGEEFFNKITNEDTDLQKPPTRPPLRVRNIISKL
jgi:hypothetical protein